MMSKNNYPFVNCLHPQKIINPYTHELMVVPCNNCKACLMRKSQRYVTLCDFESQFHKYALFVTLTYSDDFLPVVKLWPSIDKGLYSIQESTFRTKRAYYGSIAEKNPQDFFNLSRKVALSEEHFNDTSFLYPYLCKRDVQLFLKRLRKHIDKISHEKIRYFMVGEYGPIHFRPHYHFLLWFSDGKILSEADKIIRESWRYGRVDAQLVEGQANRYVAKYLNRTNNLPPILRQDFSVPFISHSKKLGRKMFETIREEVYELPASEVVQRGFFFGSQYKTVNLWAACYSLFFPKCYGYGTSSSSDRLRHYCFSRTFDTIWPDIADVSLLDKSKFFALQVFRAVKEFGNVDNIEAGPDAFLLADTIRFYSRFFPVGCDYEDDDYNKYQDKIYRILLVSRYFLTECCFARKKTLSDGSVEKVFYSPEYVLKRIESFYSELELLHLNSFYESQQLYFDSDLYVDGDEDLFYDHFFDFSLLEQKSIYKKYKSEREKRFESYLKTKKQNDCNKLLFN